MLMVTVKSSMNNWIKVLSKLIQENTGCKNKMNGWVAKTTEKDKSHIISKQICVISVISDNRLLRKKTSITSKFKIIFVKQERGRNWVENAAYIYLFWALPPKQNSFCWHRKSRSNARSGDDALSGVQLFPPLWRHEREGVAAFGTFPTGSNELRSAGCGYSGRVFRSSSLFLLLIPGNKQWTFFFSE